MITRDLGMNEYTICVIGGKEIAKADIHSSVRSFWAPMFLAAGRQQYHLIQA